MPWLEPPAGSITRYAGIKSRGLQADASNATISSLRSRDKLAWGIGRWRRASLLIHGAVRLHFGDYPKRGSEAADIGVSAWTCRRRIRVENFRVMKAVNVSQLEFDTVADGGEHRRETEPANVSSAVVAAAHEAMPRANAKTKTCNKVASDATPTMESLLTFVEAARVLGVSLRQFRRLVDGGKVAFVRVSTRSPRIRPSELQRFLNASAVKFSEDLP